MTSAVNDNAVPFEVMPPKAHASAKPKRRGKLTPEKKAQHEADKVQRKAEREAAKLARAEQKQREQEVKDAANAHRDGIKSIIEHWQKDWKNIKPSLRKIDEPRCPGMVCCVTLNIDQAKAGGNGWAICRLGELVASGEVRLYGPGEVNMVVRLAIRTATDAGLPLVLVTETPAYKAHGGGRGGAAAAERWKGALFDSDMFNVCPLRGNSGPIAVDVAASRHRKHAFGYGGDNRDKARALEQDWCRQRGHDAGDDEAAAILIGHWACVAVPVLKALPANLQILQTVGASSPAEPIAATP